MTSNFQSIGRSQDLHSHPGFLIAIRTKMKRTNKTKDLGSCRVDVFLFIFFSFIMLYSFCLDLYPAVLSLPKNENIWVSTEFKFTVYILSENVDLKEIKKETCYELVSIFSMFVSKESL